MNASTCDVISPLDGGSGAGMAVAASVAAVSVLVKEALFRFLAHTLCFLLHFVNREGKNYRMQLSQGTHLLLDKSPRMRYSQHPPGIIVQMHYHRSLTPCNSRLEHDLVFLFLFQHEQSHSCCWS